MIKFFAKLLLIGLLMLLTFMLYFAYCLQLPNVYTSTFMGVTSQKLELLSEVHEEKIVFVGGSNLIYGVSCEKITQELGVQTFNMGTTAYLGLPFFLSEVKPHLNSGDTVVLSLEYPVLGGVIDYRTVLTALGNHENVWQAVPISYVPNIATTYLQFIQDKREHINLTYTKGENGEYIDVQSKQDAYYTAGFNDFGDRHNIYDENILEHLYNTQDMWTLSADTVTDDILKQLNNFKKWADENGVHVYLTYPTFNRLALSGENGDEAGMDGALELENYMLENCDIPWVGSFTEGIMHEDYFSDTNNHLNSVGKEIRTQDFINDYIAAVHNN